MDVEIVSDKMPLGCQWVGCYPMLDMFDEIFLVARFAGSTGDQFTTGNIEITGKRQRTVPDIFKLTSFYFAWAHRQSRMLAFQSLHAGHFIQALYALSLFCSFRRLSVDFVDIGNFFVKTFFIRWCQPVAAQMWLDISLFLKVSPHDGVKSQ